jgi:hypothetical protein
VKNNYSVVEFRRWVHTDGRTASITGSLPYWGENNGWSIQNCGYTVFNSKTNTYGCGRVPFKTKEEAEDWISQIA